MDGVPLTAPNSPVTVTADLTTTTRMMSNPTIAVATVFAEVKEDEVDDGVDTRRIFISQRPRLMSEPEPEPEVVGPANLVYDLGSVLVESVPAFPGVDGDQTEGDAGAFGSVNLLTNKRVAVLIVVVCSAVVLCVLVTALLAFCHVKRRHRRSRGSSTFGSRANGLNCRRDAGDNDVDRCSFTGFASAAISRFPVSASTGSFRHVGQKDRDSDTKSTDHLRRTSHAANGAVTTSTAAAGGTATVVTNCIAASNKSSPITSHSGESIGDHSGDSYFNLNQRDGNRRPPLRLLTSLQSTKSQHSGPTSGGGLVTTTALCGGSDGSGDRDTTSTRLANDAHSPRGCMTSPLATQPSSTCGAGGGEFIKSFQHHPPTLANVYQPSTMLFEKRGAVEGNGYYGGAQAHHRAPSGRRSPDLLAELRLGQMPPAIPPKRPAMNIPSLRASKDDHVAVVHMRSTYEDLQHARQTLPRPGHDDKRRMLPPQGNEVDVSLERLERVGELALNSVDILDEIGSGEFAVVYRGFLKSHPMYSSDFKGVVVAVKMLKENATLKDRDSFLKETATMNEFNHANVLHLIGYVTQSNRPMIVMEYLKFGSLDQFLKDNHSKLPVVQLTQIVTDIANGMSYLSSQRYVHRDLAARNCLVNERMEVKVSDFGLSRATRHAPDQLHPSMTSAEHRRGVLDPSVGIYETQGGKIPVRWTAPEAILSRQFSSASDVWSFGIVCWETMTFAQRPYWNWSNQDVVRQVERGYRLPAPKSCPRRLYDVMLRCWAWRQVERPRFQDLVASLDRLLANPTALTLQCDSHQREALGAQYVRRVAAESQRDADLLDWLVSTGNEHHLDALLKAGYQRVDELFRVCHSGGADDVIMLERLTSELEANDVDDIRHLMDCVKTLWCSLTRQRPLNESMMVDSLQDPAARQQPPLPQQQVVNFHRGGVGSTGETMTQPTMV